MRRLFAIFIICATVLYSIMLCYADEQISMQKDLPLVLKYEVKTAEKQLSTFEVEAKQALAEQQLNIDMLSYLYYMGYAHTGSFDGISLKRSMSWSGGFPLDAPIYNSDAFKDYYKIRAKELIKQYTMSQVLDYNSPLKSTRQEFDNYLKAAVKSEAARETLIVLLQEKLMDKLVELEPSKRKAALDEIYSLRLPANSSLCNDYLYQSFEYGVRIQVLDQMLETNKERLDMLTHGTSLRITAEKNGELLLEFTGLEGKTENLQILNVLKDENGYNGLTVLGELYGKKDGRFVFTDRSGNRHMIQMDSVLHAIATDDKGHLQLKLDEILNNGSQESKDSQQFNQASEKDMKLIDEKLKTLETLYNGKAVEAQVIIKELNRYSMYLELKKAGINNLFTSRFEADKRTWKAAMDERLSRFGPDGMADFAAFIKQFVLASRSDLAQSDKGRLLTARFRNSIVQFRQPDDSSVWVTDMLYNFKYMR